MKKALKISSIALVLLFSANSCGSSEEKKDDVVASDPTETTGDKTAEVVEEVETMDDENAGMTRGKFKRVSSFEMNGSYDASFYAEEIPGVMPASNYAVSLTKEQMESVKVGDKISCYLVVGKYPNPTIMKNIEMLPADTELNITEPTE